MSATTSGPWKTESTGRKSNVMYANATFKRTECTKEKKKVSLSFFFFCRAQLRKCRDNRVNDLLKAQEVSKERGWQNSWSNYSLIAFFFSSFFCSDRMPLWTCNHSQPFGEKLWDDGRQSRAVWSTEWDWLKTIRHCVVDIFKHDSSLPPITFSFFAIINCNNTQRPWRVGRARRDVMRPKKAGFHCYCCQIVITIRDIFYS